VKARMITMQNPAISKNSTKRDRPWVARHVSTGTAERPAARDWTRPGRALL